MDDANQKVILWRTFRNDVGLKFVIPATCLVIPANDYRDAGGRVMQEQLPKRESSRTTMAQPF